MRIWYQKWMPPFAKVKEQFPDAVKCREGCADCCHALFDITLIEALYVNTRF